MKWAAAAAATASAAATAVASAATAAGTERCVTTCSNPTARSIPRPLFLVAGCGLLTLARVCLLLLQGSPASRGNGRRSAAEDRFAPRFDGLRFIETLVTAHR
uniref:Uncharacterized protein n=1 Tax=Oryza glumipatula TaxID=40148 RepID=A0A0E0B854_9ORYZ